MICNNYILSLSKLQAFFWLWLLQLLIPEDGHFEAELSLALDQALVDLEAAV
jgi:hypothetical protein